jgi:hypothetical protein
LLFGNTFDLLCRDLMNLQNHGFGLHENLRQLMIRTRKMNQKIRRL